MRCGSHAGMTFCRTALEFGAQNRVQKPSQILYAKGPARKCGCDQRRAFHGDRTALVRCGSHASMTFCRTALEIGAQNRVQKPPQILYAKGPARKCGCDQRRALQRELQKKRESPANGVVESAGPP